jgi:hypothetical protein
MLKRNTRGGYLSTGSKSGERNCRAARSNVLRSLHFPVYFIRLICAGGGAAFSRISLYFWGKAPVPARVFSSSLLSIQAGSGDSGRERLLVPVSLSPPDRQCLRFLVRKRTPFPFWQRRVWRMKIGTWPMVW